MKNVNFKKIASIVLAVTLVLSIIAPVPAAAAELKQAAEAELSVEQKLEEQKPEEQQPEEQKPEEQKPEEQKPEEQKPEEEKPEEQKPEEQQPEEEKPEEQQPETEEPKRIEAGAMQADAERNALDENGGFYFTMDKNDIPLNEDVDENGNSLAWNNTFAPTADDCIVVIRGEEEIRVGIPENAVLVKYSEGKFTSQDGKTVLNMGTSYILVGESSAAFADTQDNLPATVAGGEIQFELDENEQGFKNGSFYFTMAPNNLPLNENDPWANRFKPTEAACITIIRDGKEIPIGNTGAGTLIKLSDTKYYLALDKWAYGNNMPKTGDILVIKGKFANDEGWGITMDESYIAIQWDASLEVSEQQPEAPEKEFTDQTCTISVWAGSWSDFTNKRLNELRIAGVNTIIGVNPEYVDQKDMQQLLDNAAHYGMKIIPDLRGWDGETVPDYANHPAVAGFLMFDEPSASDFDNLSVLKTKFDALMPEDKQFYVNLHPQSSSRFQLGTTDYADGYVGAFVDAIDPDELAVDIYPISTKDDSKNGSFGITGEWGCGFYAESKDCLDFTPVIGEKVYSRNVNWLDGTRTVQGNMERPCLLLDEYQTPLYLFCASGAGENPYSFQGRTYIVAMEMHDDL